MDDPGWRGALRGLWVLVPGAGARRMATTPNALVALRILFVAFVTAIAGVTVVVGVLALAAPPASSLSPVAAAAGVALVGLVLAVADRVVQRPLDCSSDQALAGTYRSRFIVRLALAEAAVMVGFASFLASGSAAGYAVGLAFGAAAFARVAPTARHLEDDQLALAGQGCGRSLLEALRS